MSSDQTNYISADAAVLREIGGPLQIEPIKISPPKEDEVLVKMVGTGVCHTDIVCRDGFPVPLPIVLGHEGSGIVEAVGDKVSKVKPGDKVVLSFNSCSHCRNCDSDHPATCLQMLPLNFGAAQRAAGGEILDAQGEVVSGLFFGQSSFSTYALAREVNTVPVEDDVPLEMLGPLGCGVMTGAGAVINSLELKAGQSLAIFGGGSVGLSALLGALAIDAGNVIVIEPNKKRRALALELGASHAFDPINNENLVEEIKAASNGGVDHSIDSTGLTTVIAEAINCTLAGGTLALLGVPKQEAEIPSTLLDLLVKGVTLRPVTEGDANPQEFIPKMVSLYKDGKFPFDKLIRTFPFEQINEAFEATESGEVIKPVVVF